MEADEIMDNAILTGSSAKIGFSQIQCEAWLKFDQRITALADRLGIKYGPLGDGEYGIALRNDCSGNAYNLIDLINAALDKIESGK